MSSGVQPKDKEQIPNIPKKKRSIKIGVIAE